MNIRRLVYLITILAVFAMAARISMDTDTWWHLRAGKWIVENGAIPQFDLFSYTRFGEPWQYPGWLVEVPMFWIFNYFGPGGLNLWTATIVTITFIFIWQTLSGGPFLRAFVIVLAASASAVYWAARPYLVPFLLAAVYLWILEGYRWGKSQKVGIRLWILPLLMVIWANSHGGFAVGFLLWGVYFAWEGGRLVWSHVCSRWYADKGSGFVECNDGEQGIFWARFVRLSLVGMFMVLAVCINPSGPPMLVYPFKTVNIGALRDYIQEWQSPDFHSLSVQPFAGLLILIFGSIGISKKRLAFTDFALIAGFAYMGLMAGRNIALFAIVSPMVLTRHVAPLLDSLRRIFGLHSSATESLDSKRVILNWMILGIIILAVMVKVSQIYPKSVNDQFFRESLPVDAVEYIKENQPPGRIFNSYNWGGYLLWVLPEYPVFVDGRTDLYSDELIREWLQVVQADEGWDMIIEKWDINLILIENSYPINGHLYSLGWDRLYSDDKSVLYGR